MPEFYSHPDAKLEEHLHHVGCDARDIISSKKINEIDNSVLSDIAYLIGISHDFGKFTTYFQEYLDNRRKGDGLTHHGLISALLAFELVSAYIESRDLQNHKLYKFLPLISYFVVKRHHLNLNDIEKEVDAGILFDEFRNIDEQLSDITANEEYVGDIYNRLLTEMEIEFREVFANLGRYNSKLNDQNQLKDMIKPLRKSAYLFKRELDGEMIYFLVTQLLFSCLIDSDKKHAGKVERIERRDIPSGIVDNYKARDEFKVGNVSNINKIRDEIYNSVIGRIEQGGLDKKIFSITAPTGTGKTLTSLSAALKLRRKIEENFGYKPRIIYSLPFTSIIDQSFEVFEDVLKGSIPDFEDHESAYIIKHHYLADLKYRIKGEEKPIEESLALIETWDSEIIVTTFIQLFYSIIGYRNRFLKKFHNIANSIIILDEVQNIPIKYWNLLGHIISAMAKYFDCRIILLTATKPLIFEKDECTELVENHEWYFKQKELNRVCLSIEDEKRPLVDFAGLLNDWSKNSYMFVFNTIRSSLEFYSHITIDRNVTDYKFYYLSTNVIPKVRRKRINLIKKAIENNEKIIIVTTQLIEAGVDIDVDVVYRDFGPLDSIIQVAGRCNRNKRLNMGEVHVVNLIDKENRNRSFASYVYDPVLCNIVKELFKNKKNINESDFLELIDLYFQSAKNKSAEDSRIINSVYELYYFDREFDKNKKVPISAFELIEEQPNYVDIFIEIDNNAKSLWKNYQELQMEQDLFERKKKFLGIKNQFREYILSVNKNHASGLIDENQSMGYVAYNEMNSYYDQDTGFKRENAGDGALIW